MEDPESREAFLKAVTHGSAVSWQHSNLLGEYDFSEDRMQDTVGIWLDSPVRGFYVSTVTVVLAIQVVLPGMKNFHSWQKILIKCRILSIRRLIRGHSIGPCPLREFSSYA